MIYVAMAIWTILSCLWFMWVLATPHNKKNRFGFLSIVAFLPAFSVCFFLGVIGGVISYFDEKHFK